MMRFGRHEFKPGLWPSVATLLVFPLLLSLGFWQLDRAAEKVELQAVYESRYQSPPLALNAATGLDDAEALHWRPARFSGDYTPTVYLLDNQVRDQQPGYNVYSVMQLSGMNGAVLVDRGWLAGSVDRSRIPSIEVPGGVQSLEGRIQPPPATGIMLGEHVIEAVGDAVYRVQRIDLEELRRHSGAPLLPFMVRLGEAQPGGYRLDQVVPGTGQERHQGYAFQWFALAGTLLVIYFFVNLKRCED